MIFRTTKFAKNLRNCIILIFTGLYLEIKSYYMYVVLIYKLKLNIGLIKLHNIALKNYIEMCSTSIMENDRLWTDSRFQKNKNSAKYSFYLLIERFQAIEYKTWTTSRSLVEKLYFAFFSKSYSWRLLCFTPKLLIKFFLGQRGGGWGKDNI